MNLIDPQLRFARAEAATLRTVFRHVVLFQLPTSNKILYGDLVPVPYVSGMPVDQAISKLRDAGFSAQVAGSTPSNLPRGFVVYTDPSGSATAGSTIGLYLSTGSAGQPKTPTKPSSTTKKRHGGGGGGNGFPFPTPTITTPTP